MVAGTQGVTPGALAEQLGVAPTTGSLHLKALAHADLVATERVGRKRMCRALLDRVNAGPSEGDARLNTSVRSFAKPC